MTQARVTTRARTQTLMLAVTVVLTLTAATEQLWGRLQGRESERGASSLEWAIIAGIACVLAGVVGVKITNAVNSHAAQIK